MKISKRAGTNIPEVKDARETHSVDEFLRLIHPNVVCEASKRDADWKNFKPRQESCRGLEFLKRDLVILPTNRDGDVLLMSFPPTYSPKK